MKVIDAHIHLDSYETKQRDEILNSLKENEIEALISVSMDLASSQKNLDYHFQSKQVYTAFGYHPEQEIPSEDETLAFFKWIREHSDHMIAIGEVGLPYYRNQEQILDYKPYIELLEKFIKLAYELNKPIVLHAVYEDADIVCCLLEKYNIKKAHFHWFKGNNHTIKRMIENGYYISITPDVLYENEIQELIKIYPLNQLMVETDGPWPFEGPFKGEYTHPRFIHESIRKIAEIKELELEEVYKCLYKNTKEFFGL